MKSRYHLLLIFAMTLLVLTIFMFSPEFRRLAFRSTQIDSIGHMIGFFALTWVLHSIIKLPLVNVMLTMVFYSALTEMGQYYLGFRNGELNDFYSDLVGIALFGVIRWAVLVYGNKHDI